MKIKLKNVFLATLILILGIFLITLLALVFTYFNNQTKNTEISYAILETSSEKIKLEVAKTDSQRAYGLMNRTYLDSNSGMIFVFEKEQALTFWMKNTLIPLDIIYLDQNYIVTKIYTDTKTNQTVEVYPSKNLSKFAIELNAGSVDRFNIKEGDKLDVLL